MYQSVPEEHKKNTKKHLKGVILTISTSKYREKEVGKEDFSGLSGEIAKELVERKAHEVIFYDVLPDEKDKIRKGIKKALLTDADFIITTGGTGLTKSDVTIEVVSKLLNKEIPGFGELFRLRSSEKIGSSAVLSRAIAGVIGDKVIFCLPGSPDAVKTALEEIIIPEIAHIIKHVKE